MQRAVERGNGIEGNKEVRREKEVRGKREGKGDGGKQRRQKENGIQKNVEEIDLKEMKRNIKEMR